MKRFLLLYGIILTLCFSLSAQNGTGDRVKTIEIGWLTKQMNLTPEEAERFFPLFNQYWDEIRKIKLDAIGNKEYEIITDEKIVNVKKRYNSEFAKVLPPDKVNLFFRSDRQFQTFVQRELMERRQLRMQEKRPFLR
jgi:hypothetical protein